MTGGTKCLFAYIFGTPVYMLHIVFVPVLTLHLIQSGKQLSG